MQTLKLNHELAELVLAGMASEIWLLFDDMGLSVDDEVQLVDRVVEDKTESWKAIGIAKINEVIQKRIEDISDVDAKNMGMPSGTVADIIAKMRTYYGEDVSIRAPVKIIRFTFTPIVPDAIASVQIGAVERVTIYADGGSRGNPGPSASGYVICDERGKELIHQGKYLGVTTNNQAEYTALKLALEKAKTLGAREVEVYMDSMLVINQMKGTFKIKNRDLWPIHNAILALSRQFKQVKYTLVPRELNKRADATVNAVLDAHLKNP